MGLSPRAIALFAFAPLLVPSPAGAFCRTITSPLAADYDPSTGCYAPTTPAIPLWWSNACVGFSVQQDASAQVSWSTADAVARDSFARWSAPSCAGASEAGTGAPSIDAIDEGAVSCDLVQYSPSGPNQHTILFRDANWPHDDPFNTLALTTVTFDKDTGEILDADMELNTAQHTVVTTRPVPADAYDLESILTHEAGHFLGLAHTPTTSAVMYAHYQPGTTALTSDDIDGICAIPAERSASHRGHREDGLGPAGILRPHAEPTLLHRHAGVQGLGPAGILRPHAQAGLRLGVRLHGPPGRQIRVHYCSGNGRGRGGPGLHEPRGDAPRHDRVGAGGRPPARCYACCDEDGPGVRHLRARRAHRWRAREPRRRT